jgi:hypothetical protein
MLRTESRRFSMDHGLKQPKTRIGIQPRGTPCTIPDPDRSPLICVIHLVLIYKLSLFQRRMVILARAC